MADKDVAIWQAKEAFLADGMTIQVGDTVAAGHPVLKGRSALFEPFQPMYDHQRDKGARSDALKSDKAARAAAGKAAKGQARAQAEADEAAAAAKEREQLVADSVTQVAEARGVSESKARLLVKQAVDGLEDPEDSEALAAALGELATVKEPEAKEEAAAKAEADEAAS